MLNGTTHLYKAAPLVLASTFAGNGIPVATVKPSARSTAHLANRKTAVTAKAATVVVADQGAESRRGMAVLAVVTVQKRFDGLLSSKLGTNGTTSDDDSVGERLLLEIVSTQPEVSNYKFHTNKVREDEDMAVYEASFIMTIFFGKVGAVLVENEHHKEMYVQSIRIYGAPPTDMQITCNSWVHTNLHNPQKSILFTDRLYLPFDTPAGLTRYRELDLVELRGNGHGERQEYDRIYDYTTYNDLGDPDYSLDLKRPVLGGPDHPYPRRCRTGRPPTRSDPLSESRVPVNYVPRDEKFSDVKEMSFSANVVYAVLESLLPTLEGAMNPLASFPCFAAIDTLFDEGVKIPADAHHNHRSLKDILPQLVTATENSDLEAPLRFDLPALFSDEEFGRQTLAGPNPSSIQLVTEWPLKSTLDPEIYGPPESALTTELVQSQIGGFITVKEAVKQKKLFIIDYHDAFLPYVNRVRDLGQGTTLYGTRTLFCLMPDQTLKPVAIELTRPPSSDGLKPQWKQVYTPVGASTAAWLWKFAEAHALANDSAARPS